MSEHQDTQFEQFVLVILAVVAGIAAVIYTPFFGFGRTFFSTCCRSRPHRSSTAGSFGCVRGQARRTPAK
jgi:hypothetical protein